MRILEVNLPHKSYPILIGKNIFEQLPEFFKNQKIYDNKFVVVDKKVWELYSTKIRAAFVEQKGLVNFHILESTEQNKTWRSLDRMFAELISQNYNRDTAIIAIGGGIIGDVGGFAAATYTRGIQLVQIPTTLLAAIDSAVGGKTGINFGYTKNIIGAFYQPDFILEDTEFFASLGKEEFLCGLGELVKYALILEEDFFDFFFANIQNALNADQEVLKRLLVDSVQFKADIVMQDEKESGLRKILNLGHTFGHAIEVHQNFRIKHGQAVIIGINCAIHLSRYLDIMSEKVFNKLKPLIEQFAEYVKIDPIKPEVLFQVMKRDKKNRDGKIKFVLLKEPGTAVIDVEADTELVNKAIANGCEVFYQNK